MCIFPKVISLASYKVNVKGVFTAANHAMPKADDSGWPFYCCILTLVSLVTSRRALQLERTVLSGQQCLRRVAKET